MTLAKISGGISGHGLTWAKMSGGIFRHGLTWLNMSGGIFRHGLAWAKMSGGIFGQDGCSVLSYGSFIFVRVVLHDHVYKILSKNPLGKLS